MLAAIGSSSPLNGQLSTNDHLAEPGFWPTQSQPSRKDYVGTSACTSCHGQIVATQLLTPMARAAGRASASDILRTHPQLSFSIPSYRYQIETTGGKSTYTVTNENATLTAALDWAFGTGRVGQSYLFKTDGSGFYEARVTYFESLHNLAFTPFRNIASPKDTEEAMDRPVAIGEIGQCFGCHATAAVIDGRFDESGLMPGVACEACHGPGREHVETRLQTGPSTGTPHDIFNPAHLSPTDSVDFCGACHGTWWDVKLAGVKGVSTTRSAPYRLETSKCWRNGDARLTCIACHDPHLQLETKPSAYDAVCLSCHVSAPGSRATADHPGSRCPVGNAECTTCHMQKVYVPEMHDKFTDHRIRIVRTGEPFAE